MAESVYKIIELVGTSTESWEKAAAAAVKLAAKSLRDLRVAEIVEPRHEDRGRQGQGLPRQGEGLVQVRGRQVGARRRVLGSLKKLFEERVAPQIATSSPRGAGARPAPRGGGAPLRGRPRRRHGEGRGAHGDAGGGAEHLRARARGGRGARPPGRGGVAGRGVALRVHVPRRSRAGASTTRSGWWSCCGWSRSPTRRRTRTRSTSCGQVAGLLHVPHPDFIDAKIRARAQSGLDKG